MPRVGFFDYLASAFFTRWNLLIVAVGAFLALRIGLSPLTLGIVLAAETAFLLLLIAQPGFRRSIDAAIHERESALEHDAQVAKIRSTISEGDWTRFEALRNRCRSLLAVGRGLESHGPDDVVDAMRGEALERLLWLFLKLLYTRDGLTRFLGAADRKALEKDLNALTSRIDAAKRDGKGESLLRALEDQLVTMRQRRDNFVRAAENREAMEAELGRIEQKIAILGETAANRVTPGEIGTEADGIAAGVAETETALKGIEFVPSLPDIDPPRFLRTTA